MNNRKLSFVIPCYGSEKTIEHVVSGIVETVSNKNPYEIICVNDCSPDNVFSVLKNLASSNSNIKVISFSKNFGQQNALIAGYRFCTGDIVISLDDDGQTDPHFCYTLIDAIGENADVVYARYPQKKHSLFRNFGSKVSKAMSVWLAGWPKTINCTSYFAAKKFIIDEIIRYENPYTFPSGMICRATKNIINVEIEHHIRESGKSGYTLKKLLNLWLNGFTQFSIKPLRVSTFLGVFIAFIGFIFAIITLIRKIIRPDILAGYSSLMCVLLVIGGLILMMMGMLGEYIGRIYISLNKAPQYVICETINIEGKTIK